MQEGFGGRARNGLWVMGGGGRSLRLVIKHDKCVYTALRCPDRESSSLQHWGKA